MKTLKYYWRSFKLMLLRKLFPAYYVEFLRILSAPTAHQLFYDMAELAHTDRKLKDLASPAQVKSYRFDPLNPYHVKVRVHVTEDGDTEPQMTLSPVVYSYEARRLIQGLMALRHKDVYNNASAFIGDMMASGQLVIVGSRVLSAAEVNRDADTKESK